MWTWVCILCTISQNSFHHSSIPIHFTISIVHPFTIIPQLHSKETLKLSLEQWFFIIELFGCYSSYEGDSEYDVSDNNIEDVEEKYEVEVDEDE